jgi:hypothetical protein
LRTDRPQDIDSENYTLEKVEDWPGCLDFLETPINAQSPGYSNGSIAYQLTKDTPAIIKNNQFNRVFDITKLENSRHGFYMNISLILKSSSSDEFRILSSPNILLLWNGYLDIVVRFSNSYFYRSNNLQLKSGEHHVVEINFNSVHTTLEVYLNGSLRATINSHSYYEPDMFAFAETQFEMGPLHESQSIIVDNFVLVNMGKNMIRNWSTISMQTKGETSRSTQKPTQLFLLENLQSTRKAVLELETPIRIVDYHTKPLETTKTLPIHTIEPNTNKSKDQTKIKNNYHQGTQNLF